ncbi:zinc ribbon domain-containing protein [Mycolicibacterium gadium]|uniref:NOB1 family endonuclease n=1 Tax=Mycolicibacterium gadium TaxID=1794 RepID=A0ABT6GWX5_MYCGU|nr:zinc ribbon domain-containing protein [Mycolicibacterium gadium]MDG5485654.1 NOB1 family endonuclease [Mycolicibacterium gadium]
MSSPGGSSTMVCRACETEVPDAGFCGRCGANQAGGQGRLRLGAYAVAPNEHTLLPYFVTSLFPQLSQRSHLVFRVGLAVPLLGVIGFALLRWQAPLITVGALGLLILFVLFLRESDVDDDLPRGLLTLTAAMGIVLGSGCAFAVNAFVPDDYVLTLGSDYTSQTLLDKALVIVRPVFYALLMLIPTVVIRLIRRGPRESLDGYVIGALGSISFTSAATLTLLGPQFETGIRASDRAVDTLVVQAGIQLIAVPLTAAMLGGLFGMAMWFGRRTLIAISVLVILGVYALFGLMDLETIPIFVELLLYLFIALFAVIALRLGVQFVLMTKDPEAHSGYLRCFHCHRVEPEMPFCPNCGVATHAASRSSRDVRRTAADVETAPVRRPGHARLMTALAIGTTVAAAAGIAAAVALTPPVVAYQCPPDCGRPPIYEPIESYPRYVSEDGEFSVQYPGPGTAYVATLQPDGVELKFTGGDTGTMELFGQPAEGRTAKEITESLVAEHFPNATVDYQIPNAMVGYEPGYGVVYDEYPQDTRGSYTRLRLLVMVAVKNDYALAAAAIGPYREFTRDDGPGHPSAANLQLAMDMGKYVNSFRWTEPKD